MISFKLTDDIKEIKEKLSDANLTPNKKFHVFDPDFKVRSFSFNYNKTNINIDVCEDGSFTCNLSKNYVNVKNLEITIDDEKIIEYFNSVATAKLKQKANKNASEISKIMITSFIDGHLRNNNIKFEFNDYGTNIQYDCRISDIIFQLNFRFKSYKEMGDVDLNELAFKFEDCNKKINFKNFMENFNEYLKQAKEIKKSANNKIQELENKKQKLSKEYEKANNELYIWKSGEFFNLLNITC